MDKENYNNLQDKLILYEKEMKKELSDKKSKMKQELEELKKQKEKIKNKYNNEIKELIIKYEEIKESTLKEIQKYNNIDKEKEKLENLITMNEIIKNCQKKFEDNYYINNDFIKIINSFKNSENIKIKNLFNSEKFIPSIKWK